jgi:AraC-like DNA-binding protein
LSTVLLIASLQAWFLAVLLLTKQDRQLPDRVLACWLILTGLHTGLSYFAGRSDWAPVSALSLNAAFPFLQGPFLYFYVDTRTRETARLRASYLVHLIPFASFAVYVLTLNAPTPHTGVATHTQNIFSLSGFVNAALLLSVPFYIVWSLILIQRYRERLLGAVSNVDRIHLRWLKFLTLSLGAVWLVVILTFLTRFLGAESPQMPTNSIFLAVMLFVYAIGYFGFRQRAIFIDHQDAALAGPPTPEATGVETPAVESKYRKSGLATEEVEGLHGALLEFMKTQRPHRDDQLTLVKLSSALNSTPNRLSQVINSRENLSFYEFVNGFRVREAEALLVDPEWADSSVLDIAFESGFGSKSGFNRVFKAKTGLTPTEYRKKGSQPAGRVDSKSH